jgi:NADH:ubiquinone oxidoreductase subunit 6 (subunit J)
MLAENEPILEAVLFYAFAALAALGALAILVGRNIVRTAIWLLSTLAAAAGLYFLMGATFIGAIQLIVYTGGTLVLIIFGVMLTSKNPRISYFPKPVEVAAALALCVVLAGALIWVCVGTQWHASPIASGSAEELAKLSPADTARLTDLNAVNNDGTANIGRGLLTTYLVPFEVLSLLLLAVLIGASYLARPRVPAPARVLDAGPAKGHAPLAASKEPSQGGAP